MALPEAFRACRVCHMVKALCSDNFTRSKPSKGGFLPVCRLCRSIQRRLDEKTNAMRRARLKPPKVIRAGQLCDALDGCYGLAHRVHGKRCRHCGLPFAEEPKPELMLRRHRDGAA